MRKIYLIRHGESEWNNTSRVQGDEDIPLTEKGRKQARVLGRRFEEIKLDRIYSSDLSRAYDTACEIGRVKGLDVIRKPEFNEMSFGDWQGLDMDQIKKEDPEGIKRWRYKPEEQEFIGGESLRDVSIRTSKGMREVLSNEEDRNIAIVFHGSAMKVVMLDLLAMPLKFYKNLSIGNVSVNLIEIRDYNNVLVKFNDSHHLKEMENV